MTLANLADLLTEMCSQQNIRRKATAPLEKSNSEGILYLKVLIEVVENLQAIQALQPKVCAHWQIIYEQIVDQLTLNLIDVLRILNATCNFENQNSLCNFGYLMLIQTVRFARNNDLLY